MQPNLTRSAKLSVAGAAAAAGTSEVTGSTIDMKGFLSAMFLASFSVATNAALKVQGSNDGTTWADLTGALATVVAAGIAAVEVSQPQHRYLRGVVTRTASAVLDSLTAAQSRAAVEPVTQVATTIVTFVNCPDASA